MAGLSAKVVVINDGQVLLMQREDFKTWGLPGGEIEPGESVAQAAIREVREETGLTVELTGLVGIYARPQWPGDNHLAVFAARPVRGILRPQEEEAVAVGYFPKDRLPDPLLWWHRQPIRDAFDGVGGSVVWSQNVPWPFEKGLTRQQIYEQRDRGALSLQKLHALWCQDPQSGDQFREIEG